MKSMDLLPLTDGEQALKVLYLRHLPCSPAKPLYQPELRELPELLETIRKVAPYALEEQRSEHSCFEQKQDVLLQVQTRYLPALYHSHDFIEMLYIWSGTATVCVNGQVLSLEPGNICLIAPGTIHAAAALSDDSVICEVRIRCSNFEQTFGMLLNEQGRLSDFLVKALYMDVRENFAVFRTDDDRSVRNYIAQMYREQTETAEHKRLMMNGLLKIVLTLLLRSWKYSEEDPPGCDARADSRLVLILRYIHANYAKLSLSELAQNFNYNERYISRMLKAHTGLNYIGIIQQLKMRKAAELLAIPDMRISDMAERIGYRDVCSFTRRFKEYYGESPAEYRMKQLRSLP